MDIKIRGRWAALAAIFVGLVCINILWTGAAQKFLAYRFFGKVFEAKASAIVSPKRISINVVNNSVNEIPYFTSFDTVRISDGQLHRPTIFKRPHNIFRGGIGSDGRNEIESGNSIDRVFWKFISDSVYRGSNWNGNGTPKIAIIDVELNWNIGNELIAVNTKSINGYNCSFADPKCPGLKSCYDKKQECETGYPARESYNWIGMGKPETRIITRTTLWLGGILAGLFAVALFNMSGGNYRRRGLYVMGLFFCCLGAFLSGALIWP